MIYQTENDSIKEFIVDGQANYSEYDTDIVCANVSVLIIGTINSIAKLCNENIVISDIPYSLLSSFIG